MAALQTYWAFISYSHADERQARWLHTWLEAYRTPRKLVGTAADPAAPVPTQRPARLRPIYRDREEFSAGQHLGQHIRQALDNARNLIVVCSPSAVRSTWVNDEIRHFQSLGRGDRIFCLIVDGDPNAGDGPDQCIPAALRTAAGSDAQAAGTDALAADIRSGKDKPRLAALRIAAGMLDVRFDDLRQRDQERRVRQLSALTAVAAALLVVMGLLTFFALQQRDEAQRQQAEAKTQTLIATDQRNRAEAQRQRAEEQSSIAQQQRQLADQRRVEADQRRSEAQAAETLARQRQREAETAQRATKVQFEDATLRRIAAESRAMLDGSRAGGALMAVRLALAGLAIQPRADQFGTLQVALAAGDGALRAWEVPGETISAMALSPDGSILATASGNVRSEYRLRFWHATGPAMGTPAGAALPITDYTTRLSFMPDGRRVTPPGPLGGMQQWDVPAGSPAASPASQPAPQQGQTLTNLVLSPSGQQRLFGVGGQNSPVLHSAGSGNATARALVGHTDTVLDAAFSADGSRIATSSADMTVRLWDAGSAQPIGEPLRGHTGWVTSVAFSPDGQLIASSGHDKTIRLWRLGSGAPVQTRIDVAGEGLDRVRFSPDGSRLAASSLDGRVRVWDAGTGQPLGAILSGHRGRIRDIAFSRDGSLIFSAGSDDGSLRVWDGHGAVRGTLVIDAYKTQVNSIALAPGLDSHRLAATSFDGTLRQWDADTGRPAGPVIQTPRNSLNAVTYSADGQRLITASGDGGVRLWEAASGKLVQPPLRTHEGRATAVAASRDGKLIASADEKGLVALWDAASGQLLRRIGPLRDQVWSVGFSPDSRRLAASGARGVFVLWDIAAGQFIHQAPELATAAFPHLAFSPDGRYVATANRQRKTLDLWDGRTGQPIERAFTGHGSGVDTVAFSPDGRFVASSGGTDQTVRLWDVATGEPVGTPVRLPGWANSLAISADGQRMAVSSNLGQFTIHVWDGPAAWAGLHCQRLTRNMSPAEWAQYVGKEWPYAKQCPNLPDPKA